MQRDTIVFKLQGKSCKAIGSIVGLVFIIFAVTLVFVLAVFGLRTQQEQLKIHREIYEQQSKTIDIVKALNIVWYYNDLTYELKITITNNYIEPLVITGLVVLYDDGTYELYNETLPLSGGGAVSLPYTISSGESLTITIVTTKEPVSIRASVGSFSLGVIASASARKYTPIAIQNYTSRLLPVIFSTYTTSSIGYNSTSQPVKATGYVNETGKVVAGNSYSLKQLDDNYLVIESVLDPSSGYLVPISISNNVNIDLTDYQIKVILDSTWDGWDYVQPDGSDIYFTDEYGNPLYYWIEVFDKVNQYALIWVKVPYIPALGTTTIYMYYGSTNPYASYKDPYKTFFIYEDLTKGIKEGNIVKPAYYDPSKPALVLTKPENSQIGYLYYDKVPTNPTGFYARFYFRAYDGTGADAVWLGAYDSTYYGTREDIVAGGYHFTYDEYQDRIAFTKSTTDNGPPIAWDREPSIDDGDIHKAEIYFWYDGSSVYAQIFYDGRLRVNAFDLNVQDNVINGIGMMIFGGRTGGLTNRHELWYNITVVKYIFPEPTVNIGNSIPFYTISIILYWVGYTPVSITDLHLSNSFVNISSYDIQVYENSTGNWNLIYVERVNSYDLPETITINRRFEEGVVGIKLKIRSTEFFNLSLDYVALGMRRLDFNNPLIIIACNESSKLYIYKPLTNEWIEVTLSGKLINQNVFFDYTTLKFLILNETGILQYDPLYNTVAQVIRFTSVERAKRTAFIMAMNGYVLYAPGGGSNQAYIFDENTWTTTLVTLPEPVTPYTCITYDPSTSTEYVMFGETGSIYSIEILTGAVPQLSYEKIVITPSPPTVYPVGLAYGDGYLWVIGKGGGIYKISISGTTGYALTLPIQIPYYPLSEGDRLAYNRGKLYHVRGDGTSELAIIEVVTS